MAFISLLLGAVGVADTEFVWRWMPWLLLWNLCCFGPRCFLYACLYVCRWAKLTTKKSARRPREWSGGLGKETSCRRKITTAKHHYYELFSSNILAVCRLRVRAFPPRSRYNTSHDYQKHEGRATLTKQADWTSWLNKLIKRQPPWQNVRFTQKYDFFRGVS